jgi:hypothetical protein
VPVVLLDQNNSALDHLTHQDTSPLGKDEFGAPIALSLLLHHKSTSNATGSCQCQKLQCDAQLADVLHWEEPNEESNSVFGHTIVDLMCFCVFERFVKHTRELTTLSGLALQGLEFEGSWWTKDGLGEGVRVVDFKTGGDVCSNGPGKVKLDHGIMRILPPLERMCLEFLCIVTGDASSNWLGGESFMVRDCCNCCCFCCDCCNWCCDCSCCDCFNCWRRLLLQLLRRLLL